MLLWRIKSAAASALVVAYRKALRQYHMYVTCSTTLYIHSMYSCYLLLLHILLEHSRCHPRR